MPDASAIVLQVLGAVGTAGIAVTGLSGWLGKVWATRIMKQEQVKYDEALHRTQAKYDQQLEIAKAAILRFSENQFNRYGELWNSLCDLRGAADDLWELANIEKLKRFARQVQATRLQVQKSALILTNEHYEGILNTLKLFDDFYIGKCKLVELRGQTQEDALGGPRMIEDAMRNNSDLRKRYVMNIEDLRHHLKAQIGGAY